MQSAIVVGVLAGLFSVGCFSSDSNPEKVEAKDSLSCVEPIGAAQEAAHVADLQDAEAAFDRAIDERINAKEERNENLTCIAACVAVYTELCIDVRNVCIGATVLSLGRLIIPCGMAIRVACVGGAVASTLCAHRCTHT